jgi:hypothetical protein
MIDVFEKAGVDLHLPLERWLQFGGHLGPGRDLIMALGEQRVFGNDTKLFLPGEGLLA